MNRWAKLTVRLAKESDYLDRLYKIYPNEPKQREVDQKLLDSIENSFKARDCQSLLRKLLKLERFPYKDSYIGFLRKEPNAIKNNPKTVRRICETLYAMGIENVKRGATEPKEANTRRGQQFRDWTKTHFDFVGLDSFGKSKKGIVLLDANEKDARDFCNTELDVGINKRPDLVAKSGRKYVIGEAKFLTSTGGNQGRGFDDAIKLVTKTSGSAYKVFILDGILWIETGSQEFKQIEYSNIFAFSALLLRNFLLSLSKKTK